MDLSDYETHCNELMDDMHVRVLKLVQLGKRVDAIRIVRRFTGSNLKRAKQYVDAIRSDIDFTHTGEVIDSTRATDFDDWKTHYLVHITPDGVVNAYNEDDWRVIIHTPGHTYLKMPLRIAPDWADYFDPRDGQYKEYV